MSFSIIIPTIDARPDLLEVCMDSVRRTLGEDDEMVVMSGGTFAENCNAWGLSSARDILVFLNDDCKIDQDDWLYRLSIAFEDPSVGIVGCRLIYPDGRLQHTGVYFAQDPGGLVACNRTIDAESGYVDAVTGAFLAVRAPLFLSLGGFNEEYRNGYEDVDFCLRARQQGHSIWYENTITTIHHESASGPERWAYVRDNIKLLQSSWIIHES